MADQGKLQGWHADPLGLHEKRYFSDGQPTKLVRDGDDESYDEPLTEDAASAASADTATPGEIDLTAAGTIEAPSVREPAASPGPVDTPNGTAAPAASAVVATAGDAVEAAASPALPETAPAKAPPTSGQKAEGEPEVIGAVTDTDADLPNGALDTEEGLAAPGILRRRPRGLVYAAVAVAAVVLVIAIVAISGGFSPHPKPGTFGALAQSGSNQGTGAGAAPLDSAAAAVVTASAQKTLAQKTADVALTGTATGVGAALPLSGDGQVDFSAYATTARLGATSSGGAVAENEIATSSNIYLQLAVGGRNMIAQSTGRHWITMPLLQGTGVSGNVTAYSLPWSLQLLAQQPVSVVSLGTRSIGGVQCTGYRVVPSMQALVSVVQQEWGRLGFPAKDRSAALRALQQGEAAPITAWFDPHRQLACEMTVDMQLTNVTTEAWSKQPTAAIVQMTADFTHYGVPVRIAPPAPSDSVLF